MASNFVTEAEKFIQGLRCEPAFQPVFKEHDQKIRAGVHIFSARRLIDSGKYRQALAHFKLAWQIDRKAVLRVWYKWLQALGGALGLGGVFLFYRKLRRIVTHRKQRLLVYENGIHWE
jgi:hypothetical protein